MTQEVHSCCTPDYDGCLKEKHLYKLPELKAKLAASLQNHFYLEEWLTDPHLSIWQILSSFFILIFPLAALHNLQDLSSPTRG